MKQIETRMEKMKDLDEIEAEIKAVTSEGMAPREAEIEQLSAGIEAAARTLVEAEQSRRDGRTPTASPEEIAAARQEIESAKAQIREIAKAVQPHAAELRRLSEKARALAETVGPTAEEREEIRRLTDEILRESMPDMESLRQEMRERHRTIPRNITSDMREGLRGAMLGVREGLRDAMSDLRDSLREARLALRTSMREARAEARSKRASRSVDQTVEATEGTP